jgi:transcriptional regulator with XRE-family HTH domain
MSIVEWNSTASEVVPLTAPPEPAESLQPVRLAEGRRMHRLAEVRRQQGVSLRNVARRLEVDVSVVREQECETADLTLGDLYRWQQILEVPITELLVEEEGPLSTPVLQRAQLVKLMKTAAAMMEKSASTSLRRMVQMLVDQLLEIMPELKDVGPWHAVGRRRTLDEYGRAVERQISDELLKRKY